LIAIKVQPHQYVFVCKAHARHMKENADMAEAATKRKGGGKLRDRRSRSTMIGKRIALLLIVTASCSLGAIATAAAQHYPSPQSASEPPFALSPSQRRGFRLVSFHCARCHAVDKVGESPLAIAPALRTLHLKYPVSDLQRPLAQGVHPEMPRFQLEAGQVEDIMAYLKTLEQ
jgi:cytochrome c